jgi:hypothetical protein
VYDAALGYSHFETSGKVFIDQFLDFGGQKAVKIEGSRYGHLNWFDGISLTHSGKVSSMKS